MTPLEQAVLSEMVRLNQPITSEDPPYPASLMPIVKAVIAVVREHDAQPVARSTTPLRRGALGETICYAWPSTVTIYHPGTEGGRVTQDPYRATCPACISALNSDPWAPRREERKL